MFRRPISSAAMAAAQDERIKKLHEEISELEKKLVGTDAEAIVKQHIDLLHTYNEIKDGAQALIGRYAMMTGTTVKEVHEEMKLSLIE